MSSQAEQDLNGLFITLQGNVPTYEQVSTLSGAVLRMWAHKLGIDVSGRQSTLVKRICGKLKVQTTPVTPSNKRTPTIAASERAAKKNRTTSQDTSSSEEVDYNALLETFSSSESDVEEVSPAGNGVEEKYITREEFKDFSKDLIEEVKQIWLNERSSQITSAVAIDWWLNAATAFKLGQYVKSRGNSADQHILPHVETLKEVVGSLVTKRISAETFIKLVKPSIKRLLEWMICTIAFVDFKDLSNGDLVITNAAAKEAEDWCGILTKADLSIRPQSGTNSIILGERIAKLAHEVGKSCGIKMDPKHIKEAVKKAAAKQSTKQPGTKPIKHPPSGNPSKGSPTSTGQRGEKQ